MVTPRTVTDNYPYQLNENIEQGFAEAVRNNQMNLAMHYMIEIVSDLQDDIETLKSQLAVQEEGNKQVSAPAPEPAPKKKTSAKKTTAKKKAEEETDKED